MTAISAPLCLPASGRLAPTPLERSILRLSRALEVATLQRIQRRALTSTPPATNAVEERQTALALGSLGILPR
ncbi:MAG: hypothetical protein P0Y48_04460 [Candidatus Microbacterium phytovorans]|uniref:Uncharacterized protein n=1 Tax=Candidatus Microbacterium phytovorans TaxID=3121374 RepID=A0AAJ6B406_9MICO|nr:hypothetical protein [Microbacterium sp.]WEK14463.1 MAG: hypothetical protein P0Y48_04460 [Microbacterium sp.]